jgi:hypothetical protein
MEIKKDVKILLSHVEKKIVDTLHERPSKEALDKLAIFAGFQDWESFRKEINGEEIATKDNKKKEK